MTDKQVERYIELENMNMKTCREYDEIASMKKDIWLFDIMQIEGKKNGISIIDGIGYETLKKYVGSKVNEFIKTLVDGGWAKTYEYRKYGHYFYGIELTDEPKEIYWELYC